MKSFIKNWRIAIASILAIIALYFTGTHISFIVGLSLLLVAYIAYKLSQTLPIDCPDTIFAFLIVLSGYCLFISLIILFVATAGLLIGAL